MTPTPAELIFVDWRQPMLATVAHQLASRFRQGNVLDLSRVWIATPGSRARRRMLELLVEVAEDASLALLPPFLTTEGPLAARLAGGVSKAAGDGLQLAAWLHALKTLDQSSQESVLPHPPAEHDLAGWIAIARMFNGLHRELAAANLNFANVADHAAANIGSAEATRWRAMQMALEGCTDLLERLGYHDRDSLLRTALEAPYEAAGDDRPSHIVLVGIVEIPALTRAILQWSGLPTLAFVQAPAELAAGFDDMGGILAEFWRQRPIELADEQLLAADGPESQANEVVRALAYSSQVKPLEADDIVVALPDNDLLPALRSAFAAQTMTARHAEGIPLPHTRPYRLLVGVGEIVQRRTVAALCNLMRHPDFTNAIALLAKKSAGVQFADPLTAFDEHWNEHLPYRLSDDWVDFENATNSRNADLVATTWNLTKELLGDLLSTGPEFRKPLRDWAAPICNFLLAIYGQSSLDPEVESQRTVLDACRALREPLAELNALPSEIAAEATAAEAIALVLELAGRSAIPEPQSDDAIEVIGWLDLRLDDASIAIVTSFNDGKFPEAVSADAFLPNSLRKALGLLDNDRRFARDAYAVQAIVGFRPSTTWIACKRTSRNDTLKPSRLLFACPMDQLARRVQRFFDKAAPVSNVLSTEFPDAHLPFGEVKEPKAAGVVRRVRATGMKAYLECPFRFYLTEVRRLGAIDDSAEEMDGGAFGSLAHSVLAHFAEVEANRHLADVESIRRRLHEALADCVARQFRGNSLPAVAVQIEQLRERLDHFAVAQAKQVAEGWRIVECELAGKLTLRLSKGSLDVHGRIDRIDFHPRLGWQVWDYKTSDAGDGPEKAHRNKTSGEWIDLQLPLYRDMAVELLHELGHRVDPNDVRVGYINLSRDPSSSGFKIAAWEAADFADARIAALEIATKIAAGEFWPPNTKSTNYDNFAELCALAAT